MKDDNVDLVLLNGNIVTVDPDNTIAEALAVKGGRIHSIGRTGQIETLAKNGAEVLDLRGKTLLPGFVDAHAHLASTAVGLTYMVSIHSPPVTSCQEILTKIKETSRQTPKGKWIIARGCFNQPQKLIEKRYPTRSELDEAVPDHPVVLMAGTHLNMLNSMALKLAGFSADAPQPPHGHIYKDPESGKPTGMISELYGSLPIPEWTYEQTKKAVLSISHKMFIQQGVTTVHELPGSAQDVRIYQELVSDNELPLRLRFHPVAPRQIDASKIEGLGLQSGFGNQRLTLGGIKIFTDGGTSGSGAAMYEAYDDDPENYGSLAMPPEKLTDLVVTVHKAGLQALLHACGDRAQDLALDAIEAALKEVPVEDHRHRIEHAGNYFATPERIDRMKKLGVLPVSNPQMLNSFGDFLEGRFGQRASKVFPFKSILDRGVKVVLSSDSTGTQPEAANPFWGIWCAVERKTYNGDILNPDEKIDVMNAVRAYTINAAYAGFEEDVKGSIEQGKLADMIVLSDDILSVPTDAIKDIKVETTIIDGKIVYEA
jgi:predicted amidohydrolase YtcJ